ncbi:hypothetical protein [Protofrankia symbiont of Coriaria ruscifolia]|uniref:hypothetical protein n=1 Tax=Protofrankia symbiont of Coriaria ruscifolia TaxID=1306542 RepID=UPI001041A198|nr:hypothetical protein [Protofrankia symbiont of Coriaria ruscifolia]
MPLADDDQADEVTPSPVADTNTAESKKERGPSQASQLAALARERYELFMSEDGRPYGVGAGPHRPRAERGSTAATAPRRGTDSAGITITEGAPS